MKKVLIVTHAFPPVAGSGVIRTLKFAKYLPENGWQPVILTLKEKYGDKMDTTMAAEIPPETPVIRTFMINPLLWFRKRADVQTAGVSAQGNKNTGGRQSLPGRLKKSVAAVLTTPDKCVGWFLPGVWAGLRALRTHKIDVIYSTSPVETPHVIALALKKITGMPWVADFRDPWMLRYEVNYKSKKLMRVESALERSVMRNATAVIANNDSLKAMYLKKYGALIDAKTHVIINGYDSGDFPETGPEPQPPDDVFTISHVGEFYVGMRTPDNFLRATAELIAEGRIPADRTRITFVGGGEYTASARFSSLLDELRLRDLLTLYPHLPHRESIEHMFRSHVLLLLQPAEKNRAQIPAKAFEYLRTGRHILLIAPEGATRSLVSSFSNNSIAGPDDIGQIKNLLAQAYGRFANGELRPHSEPDKLARYDRRALTKDLAGVLNGALKT